MRRFAVRDTSGANKAENSRGPRDAQKGSVSSRSAKTP
jgi:hypothetical protein